MTVTSADEALCVTVIETKSGRRFASCGQELVMIPLAALDPTGGDRLLLAKDYAVGSLLFPLEGHEQVLRMYCQSLSDSPAQ